MLRHVAMVAKFLDDNKPKIHLRSKFALHRCYSMSFNLSHVGEIFCTESERTVSEFRKDKETFCFVFTYSVKRVSCRSRATMAKKCAKKRDTRAKLLFYFYKLIVFCRSRCRRRRCCLSTLLLWFKKFATMVTWRYTSPLYSSVIWKENKAIREITTLKEVGHKILWGCRIPLRDIDLQ